MTSNETREAYRKVKVNLLSHPYAVEKIPPKVKGGEDINISISFSPQQASNPCMFIRLWLLGTGTIQLVHGAGLRETRS